ncbi:MAG TPA: sigma-70 family RNA polymerase sigma factor [Phnomibacter sp.]|nr:sigma-70 family RNA polymerase sigma factor [Phnomibacter sp.]
MQLYSTQANQEALAVLYTRYADLLFGVGLKYLKDADAAADACSDIYTQLVDKLLKHEVTYFKGWLHTLARNHCLMQLRQAKKMPQQELQDFHVQFEPGLHLEEVINKENHLESLQYCMDKLAQAQKQAVELFYLQQKSYQEIAALTGMPWNTVRSHIQNGRRNLKQCMDKQNATHA